MSTHSTFSWRSKKKGHVNIFSYLELWICQSELALFAMLRVPFYTGFFVKGACRVNVPKKLLPC